MRAVVTVLRARTARLGAGADAALEYVLGPRANQSSLADGGSGAESYYADQTPEGPGRWLGYGARRFGITGPVDREAFARVLRGESPETGEALISAQGSSRRAQAARNRDASAASWDQARFSLQEAAALLGVTDRYLRRVASRTRQLLVRSGGNLDSLRAVHGTQRAFLVAETDDDGRWWVERAELARFAAARRDPSVVIGYDVTFTLPKSVSILWAAGDAQLRAAMQHALDDAVGAGFAYLQEHCSVTGRGPDRQTGMGLTAGAFTHATSRRLDPHLHTHVVIANLIERGDGQYRTLDGSALYEHAKTAGYLAGAQFRNELTRRLGVAWRPVASGIFEIDGIARAAIEAMSTRAAEIAALAAAHDVSSAVGRRHLALQSRPAKAAVVMTALEQSWRERLTAVGFDMTHHTACLDRQPGMDPPPPHDEARLAARLVAPEGLTAASAVFTRGEVIQAVADWAGDRLSATGVLAAADRILVDPRIVRVGTAPGATARYTTTAVVSAELAVLNGWRAGLRERGIAVGAETVERVAAASSLSAEQRDGLVALTSGRTRVHAVVGAAGSGKTHLLRAAAHVWHESGHRTVGVAVQGTAAEHLEQQTAIPTRTVASVVTQLDRDGPGSVFDDRTVLVVDEASTVGTFDLAALVHATQATDARLVLVGDPAQHQAVAASGGFAAIVRRHGHRSIRLTEQHRQGDPALAEVRRAVAELRRRDVDVALHRLYVDQRVHDAPSRDEALDAMVRDWATDRQARPDGSRRTVCMVSEDHRTRRELIGRARRHLQMVGELIGPAFEVGGQEFQVGDEVIARAPDRSLHPSKAPELHVRNGTTGHVRHVRKDTEPGVVVEFVGRGEIFVPAAALEQPLRRGVVGLLTHSYALTSHAAQGATFDVARVFASPTSSPAGLYVAASRGREDLGLYSAPEAPRSDDDVMVRDVAPGLAGVAAALRRRREDGFALDRDPSLALRITQPATGPPALAPLTVGQGEVATVEL